MSFYSDEIHYNSMAELSSSSRGDSPKQACDTDCSRRRWQSDGKEIDDCCQDSLLALVASSSESFTLTSK